MDVQKPRCAFLRINDVVEVPLDTSEKDRPAQLADDRLLGLTNGPPFFSGCQ
jgi:hypothetical protein